MVVEFHPLAVQVRPETSDSVCVTLMVPEELRESFRHVPGQHVVLRAEIDGQDVRRSYSICTSPSDDVLRVGIKRIPDGVFSTYATTVLGDGDTLDVMAPMGDFAYRPDSNRAGEYVALVAGSGITPVLSILTTVLEVETQSRCTLVYGNRNSASIMFIEEIEALKSRYPDRFRIVHILSRELNDVETFNGRIDEAKLRLLADSLLDIASVDAWFVCGPLDMVETASETLSDLGVDSADVHFELFFDERIEAAPVEETSGNGLARFAFSLDGRTSEVMVDPSGPSLLDYARSVRSDVPFACKGGMCATCKAQIIEGTVTMTKNYALTEQETAVGLILTCQAHPSSDEVTISYDLSGPGA